MPKRPTSPRRRPAARGAFPLRPIALGAAIGAVIGAVLVLLWLNAGREPVAARRPVSGNVVAPALKPPLPEPIARAPEDRQRLVPSPVPQPAPTAAPPPAPPAAAASVPEPASPPRTAAAAAAVAHATTPAAAHPAPPRPPAVMPPQLASLPPPTRPPPPVHPGAPAWRRNAVAVAPQPAGVPRIAVVIDDLGPRLQATIAAIALPPPLTLAFLPYADDLQPLIGRARGAGHEIIVHMPMEPINGSVDPGPGALRVALPADELRRRIGAALGKFTGYVGLNNHMGSRFTADRTAMTVLLDEMAGRGLLLLDSRTTAGTVAEGLARGRGVPFVARDVFLDNDQQADAVESKLAETEAVARRRGHAVAIGHPHPATRAALAAWLPRAAARGFQLVPISSLARVAAEGEARR